MPKMIKDAGKWDIFREIIEAEKEYTIIKHEFDPKTDSLEGFSWPHFHSNATQWIIVEKGNFEITINGKTEEFNLNKDPTVITIFPKEVHFLKPLSHMQYLEIKDMRDEMVCAK